jgi:purine nucleoside permease
VDLNRVLVLRTASNFDQPQPGITPAENLAKLKLGSYPAYLPSLEAAWRVGNTVVENLVKNWAKFRDVTPAGKP